jgi:hypothetical protein
MIGAAIDTQAEPKTISARDWEAPLPADFIGLQSFAGGRKA